MVESNDAVIYNSRLQFLCELESLLIFYGAIDKLETLSLLLLKRFLPISWFFHLKGHPVIRDVGRCGYIVDSRVGHLPIRRLVG